MLLAHLSDAHVRPEGQLYQGVADSNAMFAGALAALHRLDRRPDAILLSGDLVDEGDPAEYAMVRRLLAGCDIPLLLMPGNHDEREAFRSAFADHAYLPAEGRLHWCVEDFPVRIIALDTCPPDRHHGALDPDSLAWLEKTLAADRVRPTIVAMHHPPFACGIPYMDLYRYFDAEPLERIIRAAPNVERVLCGHVHRTMVRRWAGSLMCTCPSTTTEIDLKLAPDAPPSSHVGPRGLMLHAWDGASGMLTHVVNLGDSDGPFGFA